MEKWRMQGHCYTEYHCLTAIIAGYIQNRQGQASLTMFSKMQVAGMKPDISALFTILSASASFGGGKRPILAHHEFRVDVKFLVGFSLGNATVIMYVKSGSIGDAHKSWYHGLE